MREPPSPGELLRAHETLQRMHEALWDEGPLELDDLWSGVVEGQRMIAVTTHHWANAVGNEALAKMYYRAWEKMCAKDYR